MGRPKMLLAMQKGDLTRKKKTERELEETLIKVNSDQLEKPPNWLRDKVAKKEWKRLVEQFRTISIISNLDLNNLGVYCNAYSFYLQVTKELNGVKFTIEFINKNGKTNKVEHPLIKLQIKYSNEIRKYSSLLGLNIDSRLKFSEMKSKETPRDISVDFGDI